MTHARFDPPRSAYQMRLVVSHDDIDDFRHVNNLRWVRWVIDAAAAHSAAAGLDIGAYLRLGTIWVVRRQEIDYLRAARLAERLVARTWVDSYGRSSSIRLTAIESSDGERRYLEAATTWVLVDLKGHPVSVPAAIRDKLPPTAPATSAHDAALLTPGD